MDLKEKVTAVAQDLHAAAMDAPRMGDVDNLDDPGEVVENPDGSAMKSFKMMQMVNERPFRRGVLGGGQGRPLGEVQYTVTVIARWVPYDDDE